MARTGRKRLKRNNCKADPHSLHTPAKDLEHDGGSVRGQETDAGVYDDLGENCRGD